MNHIINTVDYIPSNVSTSMDQISISLSKAQEKHQCLFLNRGTADITLVNQGRYIMVHSQILKIHSAIFQTNVITWSQKINQIKVDFTGRIQFLESILSCLYGFRISVRRCDIHSLYEISQQLKIQELMEICQSDIMEQFDQYDIFPTLKLAHHFKIQKILQLCYRQLQMEHYQPVRYNKSGLFICSPELLTNILKKHNQLKQINQNFGLGRKEIDQLVEEYGQMNGLNQIDKQKILKQIKNNTPSHDNIKISYHHVSNPNKNIINTPKKSRSSSEIFFRNTLSLPTQKKKENHNKSFEIKSNQQQQQLKDKNDLKHNNEHNNIPQQLMMLDEQLHNSPFCPPMFSNRCKSSKSRQVIKSSNENQSTDSKSINCRSRRESFTQLDTLSDPNLLNKIQQIQSCQKAVTASTRQFTQRALVLQGKLKGSIQAGQANSVKLKRMENRLQQIEKSMGNASSRLYEVQLVVKQMQKTLNCSQAKKDFDSMFNQPTIGADKRFSENQTQSKKFDYWLSKNSQKNSKDRHSGP